MTSDKKMRLAEVIMKGIDPLKLKRSTIGISRPEKATFIFNNCPNLKAKTLPALTNSY